ncbi:MAG: class I SAM-dependent methyltransferase, partial [Methanobacterium sp.]|nr:class I SAM-dependent methyltransferase [Euryarchaeota archaeon]MBV1729186.1 class I SAM-dependent methyltransferase [Methanobacterium sp.]
EHLEDPIETLNKVKKILSKNGKCIIRIPVKTEYIWNKYGINWVQIDAPRHFFIYTMEGFKILAKKAGFKIKKTFFDSTEFQFWGSEQYKKDIPLESENSYAVNPEKSIFTHFDIKKFKLRSQELNNKRLGDQAIFILELNNET